MPISNFQVSRYFSFYELCNTDSHPDLQQQNDDDCVPHLFDLTLFAREVLDEAREALGGPVRPSSGFRGPALNAVVGGLPTSKHCRGIACDIAQTGWDWDKTLAAARVIFAHFKAKGITADIVAEKREDGQVWIHVERNDTLRLFTGINREYVQITEIPNEPEIKP
jgi:putative chitinase